MRAFYRGYHAATGRRAGHVRRLHVMLEDRQFAGKQALCGNPGWGVTNSPPIVIDRSEKQTPVAEPAETPEGTEGRCSRCHSLSALEDEDGRLNHTVFADQPTSSFTPAGAR